MKLIKSSKLKVVVDEFKVTRITHSQSLKQSLNYQSMDCTCGVEMELNSTDPEVISRAFQAAAALVENELSGKAVEQKGLLRKLA